VRRGRLIDPKFKVVKQGQVFGDVRSGDPPTALSECQDIGDFEVP